MENIEKIYWHPAFYAGLAYDLKQYGDDLIFDTEYELSKQPIRMDLLIIKKATSRSPFLSRHGNHQYTFATSRPCMTLRPLCARAPISSSPG